jgi:hypothetical protein
MSLYLLLGLFFSQLLLKNAQTSSWQLWTYHKSSTVIFIQTLMTQLSVSTGREVLDSTVCVYTATVIHIELKLCHS